VSNPQRCSESKTTLKGYWTLRPGIYAASTGLVSTVCNIWGAPGGHLTDASKLTLFVTAGATILFLILWILYNPILLENAKNKHIDEVGHLGLGKHGEGRIQEKEFVQGTGTQIANVVSGQLV